MRCLVVYRAVQYVTQMQPTPPPDDQPLPSATTADVGSAHGWPRRWAALLLIAFYPLFIGLLSGRRGAVEGPLLPANVVDLLIVCAVELGIFGIVFGLAWLASRA